MFQRFVFNLKGKYRRETLEGRPHLVVSTAMLGEGVIHGSEGPILYPKEENSKDPGAWNGMPLVVYHPKMNGYFVSARQPEVYNSRKVGVILNTNHDDEKLRTEAWFDEERTKEVDERVYNAIVAGEAMEVSTGLNLDQDGVPGEYNGVKYTGKARNYRPDHLAVLPDQKGAYSIAMGGGLFANQAQVLTVVNCRWTEAELAKVSMFDFADPENRQFPVHNQADLENAAALLHNAANPTKVKRRLQVIAEVKGLKVPETWTLTANEMSFRTREALLQRALATTYGDRGTYWQGWIDEVYDGYVVFYSSGKLQRVDYTATDTGVALKGDPVEVVRTTDYQPVANLGGTNKESDMAFDKKAHVTALISNGQIAESDRAMYEGLDEKVLQGIKVVEKTAAPAPAPTPAPAPVAAPAVNAGPQDLRTYLNSMPPELRMQVERGMKAEKAQKDSLITRLIGNGENPVFTKEFLETKTIEELQGWAQLLSSAQGQDLQANNSQPGMFANGYNPGGQSYAGAGGTAPWAGTTNNAPLEEPLDTPELFPAK